MIITAEDCDTMGEYTMSADVREGKAAHEGRLPPDWCSQEFGPNYRLKCELRLGERVPYTNHVYMHERHNDGIREAGETAWVVDSPALLSYMQAHPDKVRVQNQGAWDGVFVSAEWRVRTFGRHYYRLVPCEPRPLEKIKLYRHKTGLFGFYRGAESEELEVNKRLSEGKVEIMDVSGGYRRQKAPCVNVFELGGKGYKMVARSFWEALKCGWVEGTEIRGTFEIVNVNGDLRIKWIGPPDTAIRIVETMTAAPSSRELAVLRDICETRHMSKHDIRGIHPQPSTTEVEFEDGLFFVFNVCHEGERTAERITHAGNRGDGEFCIDCASLDVQQMIQSLSDNVARTILDDGKDSSLAALTHDDYYDRHELATKLSKQPWIAARRARGEFSDKALFKG